MKKIIITTLSCAIFIILPALNAEAYGILYPGSPLNPLQIRVVPEPGARLIETQRQIEERAMFLQQHELRMQLLQQQADAFLPSNVRRNAPVSCQHGYTEQNGFCVIVPTRTNSQICQDSFGLNSDWDGTMSGNNLNCSCKAGYVWNDQRTSCVAPVVPRESEIEFCWNRYGWNSYFIGRYEVGNVPICACVDGFQFNSGRTQCVPVPTRPEPAITAPARQNEIRTEVNEEVSSQTEDGEVITTGQEVLENEAIEITRTESVEPSGLWVRIKSWFGFWR